MDRQAHSDSEMESLERLTMCTQTFKEDELEQLLTHEAYRDIINFLHAKLVADAPPNDS